MQLLYEQSFRFKFMEWIRKYLYFITNNPRGQLIPLAIILALAGYFYFHNLGSDYITLWDEAVHVNVVKNLANDCCVPRLHLTDIGIDFQDWTNNYIWVHKPLAPLYLQASIYKIGGETLFAFRLPGVLFALMSVAAMFFIASRHFGYITALISSCLLAFNSYMFELVKGRQFSGLHDLMFIFFAILALSKILSILKDPSKKNYLWFGLFAGLASLSKGGLAFLFFPALIATSFLVLNRKGMFLNLLYAALFTVLVIFPEKIVLLLLYPAEYYFEQGLQALHLFKGLEYWGRPWDYYFTVYLRDLVLPYSYLPVIASIIYGIYRSLADRRVMVLTVWVLSFFIPLSFGLTKISNFIFAALPAMLILVGLMFEWLWPKVPHSFSEGAKNNKTAILFSLSFTVVLSYFIIRLDIARVKYHLFQDQAVLQRIAILFFEILVFFALWVIYRIFEKYWKTDFFAKVLAVLSLFLILGTYARANQLSDMKAREDRGYQQQVKQAALEAKSENQKDAIFLLYYPKLLKYHLYFQYWSGLDAMEIYDRQPIFVLKKILPKNRPLFLLSNEQINRSDVNLIKKDDFGYVYSLNYDNQ